jgi:outer membrane lipoprotein carrier protein
MRICRWLVALMLVAVLGLAQAAGTTQSLQNFYNKVHTLSADFKQVQRDDKGNVVQQASGTFLLSRPGQFRWEYKQPYKQIIVSNGKVFKFYDVDLAQVTIRKVGNTLRATPARLLIGGKALSEAFNISSRGRKKGLDWVHLTPKSDASNFKSIDLGMQGNEPKRMQLHDNLGQTTNITFSHIKINPKLSALRFTLDVPDNVEVVDGRNQNVRRAPD